MNSDIQTRRLPIAALKPAKYNPRKNLKPGDPAYEKIRRSLKDFGYVDPIIWNEVTGNIVGGHQRFNVLKAEGATEVDCVVVHLENENDEKALNLALNKATGDWEPVALAELIQGLQLNGYDVDATGFDAAEVDDLFSRVHDKAVRDDNISFDPAAIAPFVQAGDLWVLGRHRLYCGEPSSAEDMARLMDSKKANLVVTDPPVGADWSRAEDKDIEDYVDYLGCVFSAMTQHLVDGGSAYVFHKDEDSVSTREAFKMAGFHLSGVCVWLHEGKQTSRGYRSGHEPVLYGWLPRGKHRWFSDRKQTTVWRFDRPELTGDAPDVKPVPLLAYPIRNSSAPNGIVLDPFGRMGGTLIACEQLDRLCRSMEKDMRLASVIVRRYIEFKGKADDVTVERDGQIIRYEDAAN